MSLPTLMCMPGDGAVNPFTIPGTTRTYTCTAGSAILVPEEDANLLRSQGWVAAGPGAVVKRAGPTSTRPATPFVGEIQIDTTENLAVIYAGPKTGWLNVATGASE